MIDMTMKKISGYKLAPNEALNVAPINRVVEHLLKNDDILREKMVQSNMNGNIVEWTKNCIYHAGDVVCYVSTIRPGVKAGYILFCLKTTHIEPTAVLINDLKGLEEMGWKLIHETTAYLNDPELLKSNILTPAIEQAITGHEQGEPHVGVDIKDTGDFAKAFLRSDLSNYLSPRTPAGTFLAGTHLSGGYDESNEMYITEASDSVVEMELSFSFDTEANRDIEILNSRYYMQTNNTKSKSDANIFGAYPREDLRNVELTNGIRYKNVRPLGTNVFSKVIEFPVKFVNTYYMVFQSSYRPDQFVFGTSINDIARQTTGNNASFVSNIMFTNKKVDSITAMLPIHAHFAQAGQYALGVPWVNEFKVTIVGVVDK